MLCHISKKTRRDTELIYHPTLRSQIPSKPWSLDGKCVTFAYTPFLAVLSNIRRSLNDLAMFQVVSWKNQQNLLSFFLLADLPIAKMPTCGFYHLSSIYIYILFREFTYIHAKRFVASYLVKSNSWVNGWMFFSNEFSLHSNHGRSVQLHIIHNCKILKDLPHAPPKTRTRPTTQLLYSIRPDLLHYMPKI